MSLPNSHSPDTADTPQPADTQRRHPMRHFSGLVLTLAVTAVALLAAPAAHAQGADLRGQWTDPSGAYLLTVGEGLPINPPDGGGSGAWIQYQACVRYAGCSALLTG